MSEQMDQHIHMKEKTDGERIVDAVAAGNVDRLQDAVNGLTPQELRQLQVEINVANNACQADGLLPVTVIVNDADHDGKIDVSGTNNKTGLTIGAEGKSAFQLAIEEIVVDGGQYKGSTGGAIGGGARGDGGSKR